MRATIFSIMILLFLTWTLYGERAPSQNSDDPPDKTVRVFLVLPNDVPLDSAYPKGIACVMRSSQRYFMEQCNFTFRLNNPVCEVFMGTHPTSWYTTPDEYETIIFQGTDDLHAHYPALKTDADNGYKRWKQVVYVLAESPKCGGGAVPGWVGLPKHDCDGAAGYPRDTARWCGGMCHELGHCWGLPDATHTDGTVMSASFYSWPNCIFNDGHVNTMENRAANAGFWTDEITETTDEIKKPNIRTSVWNASIGNNRLRIALNTGNFSSINAMMKIILYDLAGRQVARFAAPSKPQENHILSFDLLDIKAGAYLCSIKTGNVASVQKIIKKE